MSWPLYYNNITTINNNSSSSSSSSSKIAGSVAVPNVVSVRCKYCHEYNIDLASPEVEAASPIVFPILIITKFDYITLIKKVRDGIKQHMISKHPFEWEVHKEEYESEILNDGARHFVILEEDVSRS